MSLRMSLSRSFKAKPDKSNIFVLSKEKVRNRFFCNKKLLSWRKIFFFEIFWCDQNASFCKIKSPLTLISYIRKTKVTRVKPLLAHPTVIIVFSIRYFWDQMLYGNIKTYQEMYIEILKLLQNFTCSWKVINRRFINFRIIFSQKSKKPRWESYFPALCFSLARSIWHHVNLPPMMQN